MEINDPCIYYLFRRSNSRIMASQIIARGTTAMRMTLHDDVTARRSLYALVNNLLRNLSDFHRRSMCEPLDYRLSAQRHHAVNVGTNTDNTISR